MVAARYSYYQVGCYVSPTFSWLNLLFSTCHSYCSLLCVESC